MTTKTKPAAVAERDEHPPMIPGDEPHLRRDWMGVDLPLAWWADLRAEHVRLADARAAAIHLLGDIHDDALDAEADYRRLTRDALAVGEAPPPRPSELDPAIRAARLSIAEEDAQVATDALCEWTMEALAVMRTHRAELEPHLRELSDALLAAIYSGPGGRASVLAERLRRTAAALDSGPAFVILDDTPEAA